MHGGDHPALTCGQNCVKTHHSVVITNLCTKESRVWRRHQSSHLQKSQSAGRYDIPYLKKNYFHEYLEVIKSGKLNFDQKLSYADYLLKPDEINNKLYQYLAGLISASLDRVPARKPILCCCRSQMRSAWMKHTFGGSHVGQIRNPFDQWASFHVNPYFFQKMIMIALSLRAKHKNAFAHIDQFEKQAESLMDHNANLQLSRLDSMRLFMLIWNASSLQILSTCDYMMDVDRLSSDAQYQRETSAWFHTQGCKADFTDCMTPQSAGNIETRKQFELAARESAIALKSNASALTIFDRAAIQKSLSSLSPQNRRYIELVVG